MQQRRQLQLGGVLLSADPALRPQQPKEDEATSVEDKGEESLSSVTTKPTPAIAIVGEGNGPVASSLVMVQLLGGLMDAGALPKGEWLMAWAKLMDANAVLKLGNHEVSHVLQLVEILANERMEGLRPSTK